MNINEICKKEKNSYTKNLNSSNFNVYSNKNIKFIWYIENEQKIQINKDPKLNTESNIINSPKNRK